MVKPFQFSKVPKIRFRCGCIADLSGLIRPYGNNIVLVTGKNSFLQSERGEKLLHDFKHAGITATIISIPGEPSPGDIDGAVKKLSSEKIDLVAGIGGGSVLDAGKAISAMMYKSDPVINFLEGVGKMEHPGTKLPYIAVPTTSGTGSEATKNAVISQTGKNGFKRSLRHDNLVPDLALIDPELTLDCPAEISAASGMDCFTQLTEAYLSDKSCEYTDALAFEGLKAVKESLSKSFYDGHDAGARTGMSFAALTSGICLANAGLGVVHGFASSVGGLYDIPHGVVCSTFMAKSNELNVRKLRELFSGHVALGKYALLGKLFLEAEGKSDDYFIDGFIGYLHKLTYDFRMPSLKKFGVREEDTELICSKTEMKNNPVKLEAEDLAEIVRARL